MAVYFIRDDFSGCIKIGYAADPWARFSQIQCASPTPVTMLGYEQAGSRLREKDLHQFFRAWRERGEWFRTNPLLDQLIAGLPPVEPRGDSAKTRGFWGGVSEKELAALTGLSRAMLNHIMSGRRRPSPEVAIKIQRATGKSAIHLVFGELAEEAA